MSALDEHLRSVLLTHEGRYGETGRSAAAVAMLALSYLLRCDGVEADDEGVRCSCAAAGM